MPRQWNAICAIKQRDIETPPCLARWPDGGVIAASHKAHVALAYRESTTLLACRRLGGSRPLFPLVVDRFGFGPSMTSSSVRSNGCCRRLDRTCLARWPRPPLPPVAACNHLPAAYHRLRSSPCRSAAMELTVVPIVKPDAINFIFGQSHFIKTVEDLHEALVGAARQVCFQRSARSTQVAPLRRGAFAKRDLELRIASSFLRISINDFRLKPVPTLPT